MWPPWTSDPPTGSIVPVGLSNVVGIAAGYGHSLAVLGEGPPALVGGNAHRVAAAGTTNWLGIAAVGRLPLTFQWRLDGQDIDGATNPVFSITDIRPAAAGRYTVVLCNPEGTTELPAGDVRLAPFFITGQPQSQNAVHGGSARSKVEVQGKGPFEFEWSAEGRNLMLGTAEVLGLSSLATEDTGYYSVTVRDAYGATTGDRAYLSVGRVLPWGTGIGGFTNLPTGLSNVAALAAGDYHALALRADGTVVAWGWNPIHGFFELQSTVPPAAATASRCSRTEPSASGATTVGAPHSHPPACRTWLPSPPAGSTSSP